MKKNKYCYLWVIQGNYGYGWEDVAAYDKKESNYGQVRADLREYRNDGYNGCYRVIERRELNQE